jgi:hypothetical protein
MIAAADRAEQANYALLVSIGALQAGQDAAARGASVDAAANAFLAEQAGNAARASTEAAAATTAAGDAAGDAAGKFAADDAAMRGAADAATDAALAEAAATVSTRAAGDAALASVAKTDASRLAIGRWGITWNALHWIIAGGAELLAVTLPAAVAAGSAAFVLYQGVVEQVGFRLQALYGTTEATAAMLNKTTGDVLGLGHAFQTAQNAADPIAYQLLGEYVNAAKSHMVDLASAGVAVDRALGELGAKIDVDLIQQGGQLNSLLANMVSDLIEIGQVFGNLGHAVLNLAADMPGLAEVLLKIADAASRVVLWVSELPAPLILTFMVFEEFSRWGGLVVTMLGKLGLASSELSGGLFSVSRFGGILSNVLKAIPMLAAGAVQGLGSLMQAVASDEYAFGRAGTAVKGLGEDMEAGIADIPMWQAALGALAIGGFIFFADKALTARNATQQFTDSLQKAAEAASNVNVIGTIADNMARIDTAQRQAAASAGTLAQNWTQMGNAAHLGVEPVSDLQEKMAGLSAGMTQQDQDLRNVSQGVQVLGRAYGTDLTQSLALADEAGVKLVKGITGTGQAAQVARAQVAGLVQGYKAMDQTGGILGNDMNTLAIQTGLADTKVQGLNQAWDQLLSNATGLTSNFAGLITDIGEINNAITTSGKKFDVFGGEAVSSTQAAAMSMKSFGGVGAQVWSNYDSALQQAGQFTDSLRTAAAYGAVSQKAFTQQIAYTVQQLLPYARYSQTAAAQLGILVQQAGGPALTSFKSLKEWVDKNSESASAFNKQMAGETVQLSDVSQAASEFASTLNSQVASALDSAKISTSGLTQAAQRLNQAYTQTHGTVSGPVVSSFAQLVTSLDRVYGNTQTATGIANAYARSLGLTSAQVKILDYDVSGLVAQMNQLHSKTVTVTVNGQITGSGAAALAAGGVSPVTIIHARQPTQLATGAQYAAAGMAVVGDAGPELVRFGGGEQVIPSWQTAAAVHGGGGEGTLNFSHQSSIQVDGTKLGAVTRTQSLTYQRRNPSNNLSLRTR